MDLFVANNLDHNIAIICGWKLHCRAFYREEDRGNSIYLDNWAKRSKRKDSPHVEDNYQSRVHHYLVLSSAWLCTFLPRSSPGLRVSFAGILSQCCDVGGPGLVCDVNTVWWDVGCGVRRSGRASMESHDSSSIAVISRERRGIL